ncbi:basic 7S globulin 2-like protein [Carex littledalei]|uniref:Basic 7S globulin 2-like protein n=1 Tax=Carex littledalei TaxID=544730 RepID=A0A833VSY7_9POAL|nr:basic 7S globulin 2-like protein [Carex littledalei]
MAPIQNFTPFSVLLLLSISPFFTFIKQPSIHAKEQHPVKALVAPIYKSNTSIYTISLKINDANPNQQFLIDLSSTFLSFPCCPYSNPKKVQTSVTINSTDGKNPTGDVTVQNLKTSCNATSVASLARSPHSLSSQLISRLSMKKQFGICMPDSYSKQGEIFFGSEPYYTMFPYSVDLSTVITYIPLIKRPQNPSYMITLTGLVVNHTQILSFNSGTTALISTTDPYTKLRSDIYHSFIDAFNKESAGYARVASVKPFEICFNKSAVPFSRVGYYVPQIDLMLDEGKEWSIFGSNSMVQSGEEALCLGFVDGGMNMEHGMVIGGFQIENNFLLFDKDKSRLGFSSTLLFMRVMCSAFNFTSSN